MAKDKKSNPANQSELLSSKLPLHKWKLYELFAQGMRLDQCQVAINAAGRLGQNKLEKAFYDDVRSDYPIPPQISLANIDRVRLTCTRDNQEDFSDLDGLSVITIIENSMRKFKKEKIEEELNLTTTEKLLTILINHYKKSIYKTLTI